MNAVNQLSDYGKPILDSNRVLFMSINVILNCLALILFIVGMAAWSTDEETVLRTYWTYAESATQNELVTMYGLRSIVTGDLNNDDTSGHITYDDCEDSDFCDNCKTAGETALATCLLAFFCLCPLVIMSGLRIMKFLDNKILKLGSIFLTSSVLFWSIVAVWNWQGSCVDHLPITVGTTGYKNGPGYNCVVCNLFWMLVSLFVHTCTSANVPSDDSKAEPLNSQEHNEEDVYMPAPDGRDDEKSNEI